jgi:hypothetical protein
MKATRIDIVVDPTLNPLSLALKSRAEQPARAFIPAFRDGICIAKSGNVLMAPTAIDIGGWGASMFRLSLILRGIVVIVALTLSGSASFAGDDAANDIMPGCRELLVPNSRNDIWGQPFCFGLIHGLTYAASGLCPPLGSTSDQALRVVVQYIDARPARMQEDFRKLALEAMKAAWPFKP